jgi:hypothetical protein
MKQLNRSSTMMTVLPDQRITETRDFSGEFMLSPATPDSEDLRQKPLSRLSREQLAAFLEAESGNARSAHFNVPPAEPTLPALEKGLALGVLKQAAYDLRRFSAATKGADRELYLDAQSWISAHDFSWPYSFMNVCKLLNLCPDVVRTELLADASLGAVHYWIRRAGRFSRRLSASVARVFEGCRNPHEVATAV